MDAQFTGNKITEKRKALNLTQKDISEILHVSISAVSKWERGLNFPDLSLMEPLSELLGISVPELLGIENETPQNIIREITEISAIETREYKKSTLIKTVNIGAAVTILLIVAGAIMLVKKIIPIAGYDAPQAVSTVISLILLFCTWFFSFAALICAVKGKRKQSMSFSFAALVPFIAAEFTSDIFAYMSLFTGNMENFDIPIKYTLLSLMKMAVPFILIFISWLIIRKTQSDER